jgi:hypothetical protein
MATQKHQDPMHTRTGKVRLGPLNMRQLAELLRKESRPKIKAKIQNRIRILSLRGVPMFEPPLDA